MRPFDDLVAEAEAADVSGWGFDWLAGRATEERPPWGYAKLLAQHLAGVQAALDLDTGGGEVLGEASQFPPVMYATEAWPPNARKAHDLLVGRGVQVIQTAPGAALPFADASFELVTSRHPVNPDWAEIRRVLKPGGRYLAQHVGAASAFELIEHFLGPLPQQRRLRDQQYRQQCGELQAWKFPYAHPPGAMPPERQQCDECEKACAGQQYPFEHDVSHCRPIVTAAALHIDGQGPRHSTGKQAKRRKKKTGPEWTGPVWAVSSPLTACRWSVPAGARAGTGCSRLAGTAAGSAPCP